MPLLLIDYIFNENSKIYNIIGDDFVGCMRKIDKERGCNIQINELGYKIKFRCSPIFEINDKIYKKIIEIIKEDDKKEFIDYT
jgi:hypothetical protein